MERSPKSGEQTPLYRVLDAAANRAAEGLRVVEDYARFVLDDRHMLGLLKALRHDLAKLLSELGPTRRYAARETQRDVGTSVSTKSEQTRTEVADVAAASIKRAEQSLRSLEEYGKLISADVAEGFEQLRYRLYTIERAINVTSDSNRRLQKARLYVLIDGQPTMAEFERLVKSLVETGVHVLQLRAKTLMDRELLERAHALRRLTVGSNTLCVVNDRADVATLSHADGVHLGQDELSVKDARTVVGTDRLIGVSTHSLAQARQAVLDGANYIGVGPVFPSRTKDFGNFVGTELLREVAAEISLPAFAIGGVSLENVGGVIGAGFRRVAVGAAIIGAKEPAAAAAEFLQRLNS